MDRVIWCGWGNNAHDCSAEGVSVYLLNEAPFRKAQRLVPSSYGLLQILYATAITEMHWAGRGSDDCGKNPDYLFDPWENLNLGVGYLTKLLREKAMGGKQEKLFATQAELEQALKLALGHYNGGPRLNNQDYATAVWERVAKYKPFLQ